jgi:hypothetical protein
MNASERPIPAIPTAPAAPISPKEYLDLANRAYHAGDKLLASIYIFLLTSRASRPE